jgi:hypothetical protein
MANRYWVGGGDGIWNTGAQTKWATTSGGAGGAAVPTAADDVFFDANSGATVSILGLTMPCRSLNTTGFVGTISFGNSPNSIIAIGDALGGAVTIGAGTSFTNLGTVANTISLVATSDNGGAGWPITTNGVVMPPMTFGGVAQVAGGKWVLQDALNWSNLGSGQLVLLGGFLDTNSKALNGWAISINGTTARRLDLGASVVTLSSTANNAWLSNTLSNLTFNPGTSNIVFTGANGGFQSGPLTFYDLTFSGAGKQSLIGPVSGATITCHNLTGTGVELRIAVWVVTAGVTGTVVVTGTLTLQGASPTARLMVDGTDAGNLIHAVPANIQAAAVSLSNVDFRDINASGAAPWTGTSLGDMLGNSGITFAASQNRFWVGGTGAWDDTAHWSATSGGASGATIPLAQDDVFFNASSGGGTVNARARSMGRNLDFTGFTGTLDTAGVGATTDHYAHGSLTLGAGMSIINANNLWLCGRGNHTITSNGKLITQILTIYGPGGTYTCTDTFNPSSTFTVSYGTFDANDFNVTCNRMVFGFNTASTAPAYLVKMGSGTWTVQGTGSSAPIAIITGSTSNGAVQAGTSTIVLTSTSTLTKQCALFGGPAGNALTLNVLRHSGGGDLQFVNTGAIINSLIIDPPTGPIPRGMQVQSLVTLTLGSFTCSGSHGLPIRMGSQNPGNRGTISMASGTQILRFVTIQDMNFTGGAVWIATNAKDLGNTSGISFQKAPAAVRAYTAGGRGVAPARQYAPTVVNMNPVGYWRLGEASGNALDISGGNHTAVLTGAVTRGAASLITGDPDLATTFPGTDGNYFECADDAALKPGVLSLVAWIQTTDTALRYVTGCGNISTRGYDMYLSGGQAAIRTGDGGAQTAGAAFGPNLADGLPHMIALVADGANVLGYVDGKLITSFPAAWNVGYSTADRFRIGVLTLTPGRYMNGTVDEVALFNRALSPGEIAALFARTPRPVAAMPFTAAALATNPLAWWRLGEPSGTAMIDMMSGHHDGTYISSPTLNVPGAVPGNAAVTFAGGGQAASVPAFPVESVANGAMSAAIWFRCSVLPAIAYRPFARGPLWAWMIVIGSAGNVYFIPMQASGTAYATALSPLNYVDGNWHMAVGTFDLNTVRIYVDGYERANSTTKTGTQNLASGSPISLAAALNINASDFVGSLDEPMVWTRALTPAEVLMLYSLNPRIA